MILNKQNSNYSPHKWFQRLTAVFLVSSILPQSTVALAQVQEGKSSEITNQASYSYTMPVGRGNYTFEGTTRKVSVKPVRLID
ncbi:MAG TPA: hypothetical protein DEG47_21610, partial [Cyanobacteria bacterium UBA11148]|nr:hypothetical protein [Cyanobacteria bacterium UBA11148]